MPVSRLWSLVTVLIEKLVGDVIARSLTFLPSRKLWACSAARANFGLVNLLCGSPTKESSYRSEIPVYRR